MSAPAIKPGEVLALYRNLLKQGRLFNSFNYRMYTLRRVRDGFRANSVFTDPQQIRQEYDKGLQSLAMLKRQTSINEMYAAPKLVVEKV